MPSVPHEPEAFTELIAGMIRQLRPAYRVDAIGPRELLVNGRRLDLENLLRMVNNEPARGREIVEHYLDQLFAGDTFQLMNMTLEFAKPRVMPRIQHERIFDQLSRDQVAHVPFVNDTVVVFVTDLPNMTVSITTEQTIRWGVSVEDLDLIARDNLDSYAPEFDIQLVESKEGGRAAIVSLQDGYDAARLLLSGLHRRLAAQLGGDFYVALPARDMFVAMSMGPLPFVERLRNRVRQDFRRLPYPITDSFFLVTRDGVAGTEEVHRQDAA
ncbi:MAG: DUF1444 family protein [Planctomycetota bacterium]|nr:DUF1444 family protein [Planctomycetota bacterium]